VSREKEGVGGGERKGVGEWRRVQFYLKRWVECEEPWFSSSHERFRHNRRTRYQCAEYSMISILQVHDFIHRKLIITLNM